MDIKAKLEAFLFTYGEPVETAKIAELLGVGAEECAIAVAEFEKALAEDASRGLLLLRKNTKVQLATKPELKAVGEAITKDEFREQLTPAAAETLALVAYLGPVPRATLDYVRGVNTAFTVRSLAMRGLVERCDEKGQTLKYRVTPEFLKHVGATSVEQLPEYAKYHKTLEQFEAQFAAQKAAERPAVPEGTAPAGEQAETPETRREESAENVPETPNE